MSKPLAVAVFLCLGTGAILAALSGCKSSGPRDFARAGVTLNSEQVDIHKMGGAIDVPDAPHGADLTTMGGDIHLGNVASFAKVKTMGGNISIDHANAAIDATTMGGSITIHHADGSIRATTMSGDITVELTGASSGHKDIDLTSNSGTILLTVPKGFPMNVRITLAYTSSSGKNFRIMDHVGLAQSRSGEWDTSHGTPRKYIFATGRVGSGLNRVTINTINGDVILDRA